MPTFAYAGRTRAGQNVTGDLRRLAQANWQHSRRERVEAADVPCFRCTQHAAGFLESCVRRELQRLVEQQNSTIQAGAGGRSLSLVIVDVMRRVVLHCTVNQTREVGRLFSGIVKDEFQPRCMSES